MTNTCDMYGDIAPLDNSGDGRLRVPGFHLPLDSELPHTKRFAHGFNDWKQDRLTPSEITMLRVMDNITDKPNWSDGIFDAETTSTWREKALYAPGITPEVWNWCLLELQDKAVQFSRTQCIGVCDSASQICKSDTLISPSLLEQLKVNAGSKVIWPNFYPLIYGHSRVLSEGGAVDLKDAELSVGAGIVAPKQNMKGKFCDTDSLYDENLWRFKRPWDGSYEDEEEWEDDDTDSESHSNPPVNHDVSLDIERYSPRLQWLPAEVSFTTSSSGENMVKFTSYINNLHPVLCRPLYGTIEQLISVSIHPWNEVLLYRGFPRKPRRIIPSGDKRGPFVTGPYPQEGNLMKYHDWKQETFETSKTETPNLPRNQKTSAAHPDNHAASTTLCDQIYPVSLQNAFKERGLQVHIELSTVILTPDYPDRYATEWMTSGHCNEHIVATSMIYFDSVNVTDTSGAVKFRTEVYLNELDLDYRCHQMSLFVNGPNDGRYIANDAVQQLGTVNMPDGRLLVWPSSIQHRVQHFDLLDPNKPGHRRYMLLHLVDPHYRICSTRNVAPQQFDWWVESVMQLVPWARLKLPMELVMHILTFVGDLHEDGDWPLTARVARRVRNKALDRHEDCMRTISLALERRAFGRNPYNNWPEK